MASPMNLKFNIAEQSLSYHGPKKTFDYYDEKISSFNQRHHEVLNQYDIRLKNLTINTLNGKILNNSNLEVFRSKQLRQAVILAAALPAAATALTGLGAYKKYPKEKQTKELKNQIKRANDRTSAQVMAEVLQMTTDTLDRGEEVIIESAITEGVRVKPGVEVGGNPTIAVGTLFGKTEHREVYGRGTPAYVTQLSMGSDVIDGTTKSAMGLHSSLTALFVTESHVKRHLPDIYVQRWMAGVPFEDFNPRETSIKEAAQAIARAYGMKNPSELTAFLLERPRHKLVFEELNKMGICTPFDQDGDLFPGLLLGQPGLEFPNGKGLMSMIGEIGGSAEWAVGVLPLVWRGGHALGMLTSQSSLTRKDLSPEDLWKERFHYTEDEFMAIQDARFERKSYFTIDDILAKPFAAGISAFGAISDNLFYPELKGVHVGPDGDSFIVNVLIINSLGVTEHWNMEFRCRKDLETSVQRMCSPKDSLLGLEGDELEKAIAAMLEHKETAERYRLFFANEYYPAFIPVGNRKVILERSMESLIQRGAFNAQDREIVNITRKHYPMWFTE